MKSLVENDIKMLCERRSIELIELNVRIDHVDFVVSIPHEISVSTLMGTLKWKIVDKNIEDISKINGEAKLAESLLVKGVFCDIGRQG